MIIIVLGAIQRRPDELTVGKAFLLERAARLAENRLHLSWHHHSTYFLAGHNTSLL